VEEGIFPAPRLIIPAKALSQTGGIATFAVGSTTTPPPNTGFRSARSGGSATGCRGSARGPRGNEGQRLLHQDHGQWRLRPRPTRSISSASRARSCSPWSRRPRARAPTSRRIFYTDDAIRRCVEAGVIRWSTQPHQGGYGELAQKNGCLSPCLLSSPTTNSRAKGAASVSPPDRLQKSRVVRAAGMESPGIMKKAVWPMAYGSDLLGEMHRHQSEEFVIRGRVLPPMNVIASATDRLPQALPNGGTDRHRRAGASRISSSSTATRSGPLAADQPGRAHASDHESGRRREELFDQLKRERNHDHREPFMTINRANLIATMASTHCWPATEPASRQAPESSE